MRRERIVPLQFISFRDFEQLRSEDRSLRNAALLAIREIPSDPLAVALNAELERATPELQVLLLLALAAVLWASKLGSAAPETGPTRSSRTGSRRGPFSPRERSREAT